MSQPLKKATRRRHSRCLSELEEDAWNFFDWRATLRRCRLKRDWCTTRGNDRAFPSNETSGIGLISAQGLFNICAAGGLKSAELKLGEDREEVIEDVALDVFEVGPCGVVGEGVELDR